MEILPISRTPKASEDILEVDAPRPRRNWFARSDWLFLLVVVAPVVTAIVYFGFLASPVYISESSFVVRNPEKPMPSGLGGILQTAGFTKGTDEVYAAQSFAASRDALRALNRNGAVERAYDRPEIFVLQRFDPLGVAGSFEALYEYFKKKVTVQNDATTSITKLTVRAFNPRDAQRFNAQLLEMSEATVNQLNERGRRDLVEYAQNEVLQAKTEAQSAGAALAAYRNRWRPTATCRVFWIPRNRLKSRCRWFQNCRISSFQRGPSWLSCAGTRRRTREFRYFKASLASLRPLCAANSGRLPGAIGRWPRAPCGTSGWCSKASSPTSSLRPRWPRWSKRATKLNASRPTSNGLSSRTFQMRRWNLVGFVEFSRL
jgi:hypothetical protein